ncbi:hypothetical protein [Nonomuraea sp. NPDC048826]|uniref:hypothetical protein n=1 Tax=Nonomuraea sp. NPDC048826 TaxID=3364347 RepID=UPI0037206844
MTPHAHPAAETDVLPPAEFFEEIGRSLQECEEAVTACASVVFTIPNPTDYLFEVRRDMDSAEILPVTRRLLKRQLGSNRELAIAQLNACVIAVQASYDFCVTHADESDEARRCSDATSAAIPVLHRALAYLQQGGFERRPARRSYGSTG